MTLARIVLAATSVLLVLVCALLLTLDHNWAAIVGIVIGIAGYHVSTLPKT